MSNPWYPNYPNPYANPQPVYGFSPAQQQFLQQPPQTHYYPGYGPQQSMLTAHLGAQGQAQPVVQQHAAAAAAAAAAQQQAAQQQAAAQSAGPQVVFSPFQPGGRYQHGSRAWSWPGWAGSPPGGRNG